jgi:hypothetical protein
MLSPKLRAIIFKNQRLNEEFRPFIEYSYSLGALFYQILFMGFDHMEEKSFNDYKKDLNAIGRKYDYERSIIQMIKCLLVDISHKRPTFSIVNKAIQNYLK